MDAFGAIADPTRREILDLLGNGPRAAGDIVAQFSISPPAISQHLKALRSAQLIQVRVDAQRRIYTLDPQGFHELNRWLTRYRNFWNGKLDALEHAVRAETTRQRSRQKGATPSVRSTRRTASSRRLKRNEQKKRP